VSIKQSIKQIPFVEEYLKRKRVTQWIKDGYKPGSHYLKQMTVLYYGVTYRLEVLIETGTFMGDMVWAQKDYFKKIYSIELSKELHEKAAKRFKGKGHVQLLQGDSSDKLNEVVDQLSGPALFWLDGHYSEGFTAKAEKLCPILEELTHIFKSRQKHVILIDDARLFVGKNDYPTLEELDTFIKQHSKYSMRIENDIIIIS
jgi:hypothetical protein